MRFILIVLSIITSLVDATGLRGRKATQDR